MSGSWTDNRPRLERLLIDADVHPDAIELLEIAGFRITEARKQPEIDIRADTSLVRWARRNRHIVVCHDQHRDRATNQYLYPEIYQRGGRVLRVGGDNSQDPLIVLAKVVIHGDTWRRFFNEHKSGIAIVYASKCVTYTGAELRLFLQDEMDLAIDPVGAMQGRKRRRRGIRRATKKRASAPLTDQAR